MVESSEEIQNFTNWRKDDAVISGHLNRQIEIRIIPQKDVEQHYLGEPRNAKTASGTDDDFTFETQQTVELDTEDGARTCLKYQKLDISELQDSMEIGEVTTESCTPDHADLMRSPADCDQPDQNQKDVRKQEPYECSICHKILSSRRILMTHKKVVHGPRRFMCHTCGVGFSLRADFKKHELSNWHLNNVQINLVNEKVADDVSKHATVQIKIEHDTDSDSIIKLLQNVTRETSSKDFPCMKCNRTFKWAIHLKYHMRTHDANIAKEQPIETNAKVCTSAETYTPDHPDQTIDITDCELELQCNVCAKKFSNVKQLANHKRNHKPKNLVCPVCAKPFAYRRQLQMHYLTHKDIDGRYDDSQEQTTSAARPFECDSRGAQH